MRKALHLYFVYSKGERQAIITLITLLFSLQVLNLILFNFLVPSFSEPSDFSPEEEAFIARILDSAEDDTAAEANTAPLAVFDPNTADVDELTAGGLPKYLAQRLINYRSKGGSFRQPSDLKKLYGMSDELFARVAPVVQIEQAAVATAKPANWKPYKKRTYEEKPVVITDLSIAAPFDPNSVSKAELEGYGIPERVASGWDNYRKKGGKFWNAAGVERIYGLDSLHFEQLKPWLIFPERQYASKEAAIPIKPKSIDLNSAVAEDLQQLKGIGIGYASRIIKYRNLLGGFCEVEQVQQTYGFPDSVYQQVKGFLTVERPVSRINVNVVNVDALKAHPLITWKMANQLIAYRDAHGAIPHAEAMYQLEGQWTRERVDEVICYLDFTSVVKQ